MTPLDASQSITLSAYDETICNQSSSKIVCAATVDKLNVLLNQITIGGQSVPGVITVTIFAYDMGLGSGSGDAKNATGSITVEGI